jgi:outer membrane protein TolC
VEPEPVKLGVKNSATYSVTVSQLIFSGEYIVGLQASRTYLQISKINEEKQKIDLKSNVIKSYLSALILEKNKAILDSNMSNVKSLMEETEKLVEAGFAESTDLDQLRLNYNTIQNSLKSLQRQVELSYMLFKIQLGMDLNKELVLKDGISKLRTQILKEDESDVEDFDVEDNINYKLAKNQQEISELNLKRAKSKFLPQVSGFYRYSDKTNKPAFDFTINHTLGINISVPIFSSFQKNAVVQQRKIELKKAKNDKQLLEENLRSQLSRAQLNYNNALEKTQTARQNVELSRKIFSNTSKKYKEGMASSLELTQTNNNYLQAQSDYFNALNELFNAKVELEKILNEL